MTKTAPLIDIREDHWDIMQGILQKHVPQYEVWAFGSRAKWTAKQYSDLDLAIITDKPLSLDVSASLSDDFSESDLPYKVDIVDWATTSESFRKIIERDKVVVQEEKPSLGVANEWRKSPFEALLAEPVRNGIYKKKEFHGRGAKIVNMGELFAHPRLRAVAMKRVELNASESTRFLLAKGDLIFARRSLTAEGAGKCSVVLEVKEATTFESSIIRARPDKTKVAPLYLYYFFNSPIGTHSLDTIRRQVAVAGITGSDLAKLIIPVPSLQQQSAIAHILGTLDDKIELNRKQNETLEAMARALFKAWFVDFEPVRAKMEGRWQRGQSLPGLPAHLYDLFPDRLVDSELGVIPEGWNARQLGEVADVNWGDTSITKSSYVSEGFPAYSASGQDGFLPNYHHKGLGVVVSAIGANAGFSWLAHDKWGCIKNTLRLWTTDQTISTIAIYFLASSKNFWPLRGSAQSFIAQGDARAVRVLTSTTEISKEFECLTQPFLEFMWKNERESRSLTQLRDTLLPKLISGELRVSEVESFIKERGL